MAWIQKMIAEGEHLHQDFKMRVDDARKISRSLVAFANTEGGRLLVGVKDNGIVWGVRADEEVHMIEAAANMHCDPPVAIEIQVWKVDYKTILEVQVRPSEKKPHYAEAEPDDWKVYIRQEDKTIVANRVMIKVWEHENLRQTDHFEYDLYKEKLFDQFQKNTRLGFRKISRITGLNNWRTEDLLAQLIAWEVIEMELDEKGCWYQMRPETK